MRRARWLILAAITIIVFAVGSTYYGRLARMAKDAPAPPIPLKAGIDASAEGWHYRSYDEKKRGPNGEPCPVVEVMAKNFNQVKEPSAYLLEGVGLKFYHVCGQSFDEVKSAKASFDTVSGVLFSEGEVEITKGRQAENEGASTARLVKIVSSGVRYETKTGKVSTDKPASFTFENGDGKAVGADYDPTNHQLHMLSQVELNWRGKDGESEPMKVETQELVYFEDLGKVSLAPWGRLTRGAMKVESGRSFVTLDGQTVQLVESEQAHGTQDDDDRKVLYSADHMVMQFDENGQVSKITGDQHAHAVSTSDTGKTDVNSDHIELFLVATEDQSVLDKALALGHAVVQSNPAAKGTEPPAETRILRSEAIELHMRPGGRDIDNVETHAPGSLEFIPNRPGPHRWLNGEKFWIAYGEDNQIQSFRTIKAKTRTENPPRNGKPQPPAETWSDEFKAEFDPKSNQVARIEQTNNFRYQAGDRKAQSERALLDQKTDNITLTGKARVADPTGTAAADRIVMNQKSGDFTAEGHVTSTRLPDKKGEAPSAMLTSSDPMQATADKMISTDNNLTIHYEGNTVAWQGANRIQADRLDIDRDEGQLHAAGNVLSQFVDKPKKGKDGKPATQPQQTIFTIVKAPEMVYTEEQKLAVYKGGATMIRPSMTVKGREIKAFLKDAQSDSSLDHAYADGSVVIVQSAKGRTRTGTSEHAEYYAGEEKVVMTGGQPRFVDTLKGTTTGRILTYYANDDRLLVNGVDAQRAESLIHRK